MVSLHAQDYKISFSGTGKSSNVGTVVVENLTRGKSINLSGAEVLHLMGTVTGLIPVPGNVGKALHIYPNPMTDNSTIEFVATAQGLTNIEIFDMIGKRVAAAQSRLAIGNQSYIVSGLFQRRYRVNNLK